MVTPVAYEGAQAAALHPMLTITRPPRPALLTLAQAPSGAGWDNTSVTENLVCARCEQEKPGLESPPIGGPTGQLIMANVCADCWAEWRETSRQLIAHYGLVLGNPQHRAQMREVMREFLGLDEETDAGGTQT